ncbi:DUF4124 domain-containing protein [Betaproteobacteria bacterium SCN1]|nr:DUF4124 domain-containing protein [Betaproteobacteria bacterium SCN1]MBN8759411.1 DUF4124 domain-containing protein [Thiobacillus sp.]ODU90343.1 MAG: hypothetical protein ABT21_06850 [Thiobacillus sp. SCN 65-179]OJW34848.1 MAG: hypothetical protein BGO61_03190 [Thiobacillus sp. 65-69]
MRRHAWVSMLCLAVLLPGGALAASTLNKCIDAQGRITYSNLPCKNAREAQKVEIDPPPIPDPVRPAPKPVPTPAIVSQPPRAPARSAIFDTAPASPALKLEKRAAGKLESGAARKCDTLADKLGRILDKMDAARRKGYTQEQMDDWNQQIKDLERQKQQAGCF